MDESIGNSMSTGVIDHFPNIPILPRNQFAGGGDEDETQVPADIVLETLPQG